MAQSDLIQQILLNQVSIPTKLITNFKEFGLNEQEVMVIIQIHRFLQEGTDFPTPAELAAHLTINEKDCAHILRKLIQKDIMSIEQLENEQQQLSEAYCLNPLWNKLYVEEKPKENEEQVHDGTIFMLFEQEFGRPLSPFEIETINAWLDDDEFLPALIKAGLRESVLMGKLNFTYIDRILRNWKKKGIHTLEQARESSREFRNKKVKRKFKANNADKTLYYNWLEGED